MKFVFLSTVVSSTIQESNDSHDVRRQLHHNNVHRNQGKWFKPSIKPSIEQEAADFFDGANKFFNDIRNEISMDIEYELKKIENEVFGISKVVTNEDQNDKEEQDVPVQGYEQPVENDQGYVTKEDQNDKKEEQDVPVEGYEDQNDKKEEQDVPVEGYEQDVPVKKDSRNRFEINSFGNSFLGKEWEEKHFGKSFLGKEWEEKHFGKNSLWYQQMMQMNDHFNKLKGDFEIFNTQPKVNTKKVKPPKVNMNDNEKEEEKIDAATPSYTTEADAATKSYTTEADAATPSYTTEADAATPSYTTSDTCEAAECGKGYVHKDNAAKIPCGGQGWGCLVTECCKKDPKVISNTLKYMTFEEYMDKKFEKLNLEMNNEFKNMFQNPFFKKNWNPFKKLEKTIAEESSKHEKFLEEGSEMVEELIRGGEHFIKKLENSFFGPKKD